MDQSTLVLVGILVGIAAVLAVGLAVWLSARRAGRPRGIDRSGVVDGGARRSPTEIEYMNVFFNKTPREREQMIVHWMKRKGCTREEAMRAAVEDWRWDTRSWR
jgi:hypothetical protein